MTFCCCFLLRLLIAGSSYMKWGSGLPRNSSAHLAYFFLKYAYFNAILLAPANILTDFPLCFFHCPPIPPRRDGLFLKYKINRLWEAARAWGVSMVGNKLRGIAERRDGKDPSYRLRKTVCSSHWSILSFFFAQTFMERVLSLVLENYLCWRKYKLMLWVIF